MSFGIPEITTKKIQPEAVYYLPGLLDIRANWSLNEQYDLTLELSAE